MKQMAVKKIRGPMMRITVAEGNRKKTTPARVQMKIEREKRFPTSRPKSCNTRYGSAGDDAAI